MNKPFSPRFLSNSRKALLSGVAVMSLVIAAGVSDNQVSVANAAPTQSVERLANGAPLSFADVIDQVRPSVVNIQVKVEAQPARFEGHGGREDMEEFFKALPDNHPFKRFFEDGMPPNRRGEAPRGRGRVATSQGSGFVISEDGYVVTNNHVVDGGSSVDVTFYDGKTYEAEIIGTDPLTDLALLKITSKESFTPVTFAKAKPRVGDWVVAMGNPFGLGGTATAGIVSANGRDINAGPYDDFLQIDAAVNKGNSGGPTFNLQGEVVGVNSMIFSPSGGNVGIAFAIPSELTERIVNDLKDDGEVSRAWLGVSLQPLDEALKEGLGVAETSGALINKIEPESPAERAGLKVGDVVTHVNGHSVTDPKDLAKAIGNLPAGAEAKIELMRRGKAQTLAVELGDRNSFEEKRRS